MTADSIPCVGQAMPGPASSSSEEGILRSVYTNVPYEIEVEIEDVVGLTVQLNPNFRANCRVGSLRHSDAAKLGRAFLYATGERARIAIEGECHVLQLNLQRAEVDKLLLQNHDEPNGARALRPLHGQIDFTLLRLLSEAFVRDGVVSDTMIQTIVAALASRYGTTKRVAPRRGLTPATLRRVEDFVTSDIQSIALNAMASVSGLSIYHFAREFRHETGQTPWAFVTERRVWFATQLLLDGLSIDEAARGAGFAHASHMGRVFRRQFGMAPSAVRRRLFPR